MNHPLAIILPPLLLILLSLKQPRLARPLSLLTSLSTALYAAWLISNPSETLWTLVDTFGVILRTSPRAAWLLLTNALVCTAVALDCRPPDTPPFFHTLLITLHTGINAAFLCGDLFSLYVALELTTITAGLLIGHPLKAGSVWNAFRYLFISNIAMLFYLVGVVLVYEATLSFAISGVPQSPPVASALIISGLLVKGGVFIPGLWLPFAHSEAEAPVSALLSGVLVKIAVFPLMTMALLCPAIDTTVRWIGTASALLGVCLALFETDAKRLLAFSTISQVGVILSAPVAGAFYAFSHGLAKCCLFLSAGKLPSRDLDTLRAKGMDRRLWSGIAIACLSISGMPLLGGYAGKSALFGHLSAAQAPVMTAAAVGTALILAKLLFLPGAAAPPGARRQRMMPLLPLLAGLLFFGLSTDLTAMKEMLKAALIIAAGWGAHLLVFRHIRFRLSRRLEQVHHLIGMMAVVLLILMIVREAA